MKDRARNRHKHVVFGHWIHYYICFFLFAVYLDRPLRTCLIIITVRSCVVASLLGCHTVLVLHIHQSTVSIVH